MRDPEFDNDDNWGPAPFPKAVKSMLFWVVIAIIFAGCIGAFDKAFGESNYFVNTTTPLGGSATFTGATRDLGTQPPSYVNFGCSFWADQAGTAFVEDSTDGATWITAATAAIVASTRLDLSVPIRTRYLRCREVNGATPQTVNRVVSSLRTGS